MRQGERLGLQWAHLAFAPGTREQRDSRIVQHALNVTEAAIDRASRHTPTDRRMGFVLTARRAFTGSIARASVLTAGLGPFRVAGRVGAGQGAR